MKIVVMTGKDIEEATKAIHADLMAYSERRFKGTVPLLALVSAHLGVALNLAENAEKLGVLSPWEREAITLWLDTTLEGLRRQGRF